MSIATAYPMEAQDDHALALGVAPLLLEGAPWRRLAVLGDSVAEGVREPVEGYRDLSFSDRVAQDLRAVNPGLEYLNLGYRGLRLPEIVRGQLQPALDFDPDLAIVIGGANDALSRSFHERAVRRGLETLIAPLTGRGATVVTIGLFDLGRSGLVDEPYAAALTERMDELDRITRKVAADYGAIHVDSHRHPLAADPGIFSSDRIHANARGHAVAEATIVRALASVLPRRRAAA